MCEIAWRKITGTVICQPVAVLIRRRDLFVRVVCPFLLYCEVNMKEYLKISEVAEKWGIKERRINTLCLEGRVEGAIKFGNTWAIPKNAEKPKDARIKTGKYIKKAISK